MYDCTGSGATSVVQAARCVLNDQKVAIKRINLEQCGATIEELQVRVYMYIELVYVTAVCMWLASICYTISFFSSLFRVYLGLGLIDKCGHCNYLVVEPEHCWRKSHN